MSLFVRVAAPRLVPIRSLPCGAGAGAASTARRGHGLRFSSSSSNGASSGSAPSQTASASKKTMTTAEREEVLRKADIEMSAYYTYPPHKVLAIKKARFKSRHQDSQHYAQVVLGLTLVGSFIASPFIGKAIAYDDDFRNKYIPSWYDYTLEKRESEFTREEMHEQIMMMQNQLHKRAIAGEFTNENLDKMRRNFEGREKPEEEEYAHFTKLHPGVDDDEDLEDD